MTTLIFRDEKNKFFKLINRDISYFQSTGLKNKFPVVNVVKLRNCTKESFYAPCELKFLNGFSINYMRLFNSNFKIYYEFFCVTDTHRIVWPSILLKL